VANGMRLAADDGPPLTLGRLPYAMDTE